jgi:hypothetical protein
VREGEGEGKRDLRDGEFQGDGNGSYGRSKIRNAREEEKDGVVF